MWYIKIVRATPGEDEEFYRCEYLEKKKVPAREDSNLADDEYDECFGDLTPGLHIQLNKCDGGDRTVILGVGDIAYLMDEEGDTIDTYRWPVVKQNKRKVG